MRSSFAVHNLFVVNIPHFIQEYVNGAVIKLLLSRFQWSNPGEYG